MAASVLPRSAVCCPHDEEVDNYNDEDAVLGVDAVGVMEGMVEEEKLQHPSRHATQPSQCSTQNLLARTEINMAS